LTIRSRVHKRIWGFVVAFVLLFPAVVSAESDQRTNEVRDLLSYYHVSGVTAEQLSGKSISEMLAFIDDPYTAYMSKKEYEAFLGSIENTFVGIGVRIGQDESGIYVVEVFKGMPAYKAGMLQGDYIKAVDGESIDGFTTTETVNRIVGKDGTEVKLTIYRDGETLTLPVIRAQVQVPIVETQAFKDENGTVGYIKLSSFSSHAGELFATGLQQLESENANLKALVIDLRNNGGGYLSAAQSIATNFMTDGIFLHTKDRNGTDNPLSIFAGRSFDKPVYMLMNESSASASEVLAGALREEAGAKLIGTKSYGKGSVQSLVPLSGGEALKVTIQEYFTPKFNPVNKIGLMPDEAVYTDAAQIVAALHSAGISNVTLEIKGHSMKLNGVEVTDTLAVKKQDGQTYLPSRLLAELVDADIAWNADRWAVEVNQGAASQVFPVDGKVAIMSGSIVYINLDAFTDAFPALQSSVKGDGLSLQADLRK